MLYDIAIETDAPIGTLSGRSGLFASNAAASVELFPGIGNLSDARAAAREALRKRGYAKYGRVTIRADLPAPTPEAESARLARLESRDHLRKFLDAGGSSWDWRALEVRGIPEAERVAQIPELRTERQAEILGRLITAAKRGEYRPEPRPAPTLAEKLKTALGT